MKFSKTFLLDRLGDPMSTAETSIVGTTQWGTERREVFRHEGHFYATTYRVGSGDEGERPYEFDDDEIECPKVERLTCSVYTWEPV